MNLHNQWLTEYLLPHSAGLSPTHCCRCWWLQAGSSSCSVFFFWLSRWSGAASDWSLYRIIWWRRWSGSICSLFYKGCFILNVLPRGSREVSREVPSFFLNNLLKLSNCLLWCKSSLSLLYCTVNTAVFLSICHLLFFHNGNNVLPASASP